MPLRLAGLALVLALAGCTPGLPRTACGDADWRAVGMADGMEGRGAAALQRHVDVCGATGAFPDAAAWQDGHAAGLALYCVPETAYLRGRRGLSLPAVCPADDAALAEAHAFGRRYWDLDREIVQLRMEYRDDRRTGMGLPSRRVLTPARIGQLERERARYAYWPPR